MLFRSNDVLTGGSGIDRFVFDSAIGAAGSSGAKVATRGRMTLLGAMNEPDIVSLDLPEPMAGGINVDSIADFTVGQDLIMLDRAIFGAVAAGTLAGSAFVAGTAALDADDRILYNSATGEIFYDADGNGSGAATLFAKVTAGTALTAKSFVGF